MSIIFSITAKNLNRCLVSLILIILVHPPVWPIGRQFARINNQMIEKDEHLWCHLVKWVWSCKIWFFKIFLIFFFGGGYFLLEYCLGFNLVKTPQTLGNWFQRYKQLKDWINNKKQKKLSALFGCILRTVFASSYSFCLITSQLMFSLFIYLRVLY